MKLTRENNENQNIKIGALLSYVMIVFSVCIHIFYTPFFLRKVGDINFGLFSFVGSITSWFTIGVYALNDSFTRFSTIEKKEYNNNGRTNTIYLKMLVLLASIIVIISAILFAFFKFEIIKLDSYSSTEKSVILILYVLSSLQILVVTVFTIFKLYVEYESNFIVVKSAMLIHSIINVLACVISLLFGKGVIFISLIQLLTNSTLLGFFFIYAIKKQHMTFAKVKISENMPLIRSIVSFSSFLLLSTIVTEVDYSVDKTILGFFAGAELVTVYQLGMSFNTYFNELSTAINSVFIPKINRYVVNQDTKGVDYVFLNMSLIQNIIVFLVIGGFVVCGKDFITLWVGPEKISVYWIALVLLLLSSYPCVSYSTVTIKRAMNKHRIPSVVRVIVAIVNVLLSIFLICIMPKEKAIIACLLGTVISSFAGKWIFMFIYDYRVTRLPMLKLLRDFSLFALIAAVSSLITIYAFKILDLHLNIILSFALKAFIYIILYVVIVFLFRGKKTISFIRGKREND